MTRPDADTDTDTDTGREPPAVFHEVREEDHAVLHAIRDGDDTVRALNERLTLTRRQINYSLEEKLAPAGLIVLNHRDGFTTSVLDSGETRRHRKSKQARLTETGMAYFDWKQREPDLGRFDKERAASLEATVADLEEELETVNAELKKHKQALQQLHYGRQARQSDD